MRVLPTRDPGWTSSMCELEHVASVPPRCSQNCAVRNRTHSRPLLVGCRTNAHVLYRSTLENATDFWINRTVRYLPAALPSRKRRGIRDFSTTLEFSCRGAYDLAREVQHDVEGKDSGMAHQVLSRLRLAPWVRTFDEWKRCTIGAALRARSFPEGGFRARRYENPVAVREHQ